MTPLTEKQEQALNDYMIGVYSLTLKEFELLKDTVPEFSESPDRALDSEQELYFSAFLQCVPALKAIYGKFDKLDLFTYAAKVFKEITPEDLREELTTQRVQELQRELFKSFGVEQLHGIFYNPMLNGLYQISKPKLDIIPALDEGRYSKQGRKYSVEFIISNLSTAGTLSTSMRKLFFTASMLLTEVNFYRGDTTNAIVELPVDDYAKKLGKTLEGKFSREKLVRDIHTDLTALENIYWNGSELKGNKFNKYDTYRVMSSHKYDKSRGVYRICFDPDTARTLQHSYPALVHESLLKVDNKNPAAFSIGYKMAIHSEIDNNYNSGTGDVLRVITILENTSEIMTPDEFRATGRKDWRKLIKSRLEKALDELKDKRFLHRWEYRNESGKVLTPEAASELSLDEYVKLKVEYSKVIIEATSERRARKLKEKEEQTKDKPKRKRGRPKKQPEELSET